MAVSGEKLARSVGVIADQQGIVNGGKYAKAGFKEIEVSKTLVKELMAAAKPHIKTWVPRKLAWFRINGHVNWMNCWIKAMRVFGSSSWQ